jgi:1-deoxy-D-xylulose-5-phosphate reductoisomerase
MVEFRDSSVIGQLSSPDMRLPIQYALAYPDRYGSHFATVDLVKAGKLTFFEPDRGKFRCLQLAYDAFTTGKSMPCVMNAANEVAVAGFLEGKISFPQIPVLVDRAMEAHQAVDYWDINELKEIDQWARIFTQQAIGGTG